MKCGTLQIYQELYEKANSDWGILYSKANKLPGVKREIIKKILSIIYNLWNAPACSTCKNRVPHLYFTSAPSKAFFTSCIHYGKTRHFRQQSANPFYEIANIAKCKLKQQAMEIHNLLDIKSRAELREWLIQNYKTEKECWVVVKRGRPTDDNIFWYIDAVEEALCFGWIDSTTKKIADNVTAQKLCPRKPRSNWSELNKERCRRMERLGLMTDAGRAVLPDMSPNGFIIDKDILQRLQSDPVVWNNFCKFPDLYRRIRIDTIQIKKNQPELFESRLNKFIENTRKGLLYGEWNDNGRL